MPAVLEWSDGIFFSSRFLHIYFGIIWIGMLYYFNFVQGAFVAESDAPVKSAVTLKLLPRALWWFRWGAMWTMVTGVLMLGILGHSGVEMFYTTRGSLILIGALLGLTMWFNVWFVIWPNQKVVMANATQVAAGKPADPNAAAAGARALVASRTNTLLSVPMLFFMASGSHLSTLVITDQSNFKLMWVLVLLTWLPIEINALKGKTGPMTTIKGVITLGFVLTVWLYAVVEICK